MTAPLLEIDRLTIAHRRGQRWLPAVRDVSLALRPGETYGLVGESGSGKSTLARAALRDLPANGEIVSGTIRFQGEDLFALGAEALRRVRGARIGLVHQDPAGALNPTMRIGDQVAEMFRYHGGASRREAWQAALDMLARMRIPEPERVAGLYPFELSGGMQQRVVIAMALAPDPDLLVLDEPTTALDTTVQAAILDLFRELRDEFRTALLFVSHNLGVVRQLCDRIGVMKDGELVEEGEAEQVLFHPRHPATAALLAAQPDFAPRRAPKPVLPGAPFLEARGLRRRLGGAEVLRGIDLTIRPGETYALVGESGSGKTTLARLLAGLVPPESGRLDFDGARLPARLAKRTREQMRAIQMVFQNPDGSLNPSHRVGSILARAIRVLDRRRSGDGEAARHRAIRLLERVGLSESRLDQRPGQLSGGQRQRLAIARAFAGVPRLVILDEPTSALDVVTQAAVLDLLDELQHETGVAYLLISHDLAVVRRVADRIGVLYLGELVETGPTEQVFTPPFHPYTEALIAAVPHLRGPKGGIRIEGPPAGPGLRPSGCPFHPRCPRAMPVCAAQAPPWQEVSGDHAIRCWVPSAELEADQKPAPRAHG